MQHYDKPIHIKDNHFNEHILNIGNVRFQMQFDTTNYSTYTHFHDNILIMTNEFHKELVKKELEERGYSKDIIDEWIGFIE